MGEPVSDAGLIQQLRRKFGIRGDQDVAIETGAILLTTNLADLDSAPFHQKVGGTFGFGLAAVAAQFGYNGLRNPLTNLPNHRAVIRRIFLSSNAGAFQCMVKVANSAALDAVLVGPAVNAIAGSWDSPQPDQPPIRQSLQSYSTSSVTSFGGDGVLAFAPSATTTVLEGPWVLAPGNTLFVQGLLANIGILAGFYFDEYLTG
jgi:hypothetical protein